MEHPKWQNLAPSIAAQSFPPTQADGSQVPVEVQPRGCFRPGATPELSQGSFQQTTLLKAARNPVSLRPVVSTGDPFQHQIRPSNAVLPSSSTSQGSSLTFLQHGEADSSKGSKRQKTAEEKKARHDLEMLGGACNTCQKIKQKCDCSYPCGRCAGWEVRSESEFLEFIQSSYNVGLHEVTIFDVNFNGRSEACEESPLFSPTSMEMAKEEAVALVDSWFKDATSMIEPPDYSARLEDTISMSIQSGNNHAGTSFKFGVAEIAIQLQEKLSPMNERGLLDDFVSHAAADMSKAPSPNPSCLDCAGHVKWLSGVVSNIYSFLTAFDNADVYGPIREMPLARVAFCVIYASLYRLLLAKSHELVQFLVEFSSRKYPYCARRPLKDDIEVSLRALALYYRVVSGLANREPLRDCGTWALLLPIWRRACCLLQSNGISLLLCKLHEKLDGVSAQPTSSELVERYSTRLSDMKPLSIGFGTQSANKGPLSEGMKPLSFGVGTQSANKGPLPEWMTSFEPRHHCQRVKLRALLKSGDPPTCNVGLDAITSTLHCFEESWQFPSGPLGTFSGSVLEDESASNDRADEPSLPSPGAQRLPPSFFTKRDPLDNHRTSLYNEHASLGASERDTAYRASCTEATLPVGDWSDPGEFETRMQELAGSPINDSASTPCSHSDEELVHIGEGALNASPTGSNFRAGNLSDPQQVGQKAISHPVNGTALDKDLDHREPNDIAYNIFERNMTRCGDASSEEDSGDKAEQAPHGSGLIYIPDCQKRARSDGSQGSRCSSARSFEHTYRKHLRVVSRTNSPLREPISEFLADGSG